MKQHPIKGIQESLIQETKDEMNWQGVTAYQIGKLGLVSAQTVGNIEVNEGLKVFTALAILSSLGKTIAIVDMPDEMKKAVNTWHKENSNIINL
jgi:hypothetical protein